MAEVLSERCESVYRDVKEALEGVSEAEANAYRVEGWPRHDGWVGEDGSIAGLVWHCAAWKEMWVTVIETGKYPDKLSLRPVEDTWSGRLAWLETVHARLMEHMRRFDGQETAEIGGKPCRLADYDITNGEHDMYHTAQVWYLRQRYAAEHPAG